jgi:hypothetical protein
MKHCLALMVTLVLLLPPALQSEPPLAVRHREGSLLGFLALRTLEGKTIASGTLSQTVAGDRVTARLTFRFTDGSLDDETTVFSQSRNFRLLSYRHIQKGPSFPNPVDVLVDEAKGQVTVRTVDDGKEKVDTNKLDLPADISNGLLPFLLKNLPNASVETKVSYLAVTPKPRLVKLAIKPEGEQPFTAAGATHQATRYNVKIEIGGIAGVVAPVVGKQPKDITVWILRGNAPAFLRLEGQLYPEGPVWRIEQTVPVWPR